MEIIRINETEEFLAYFPEWKYDFQIMKEKYNKLCFWIESTFAKLQKSKNFQKEIEKYVFRGKNENLFIIENKICCWNSRWIPTWA